MSNNSNNPEDPRKVWAFGFLTGWSRADDPAAGGEPGEDYEAALRRNSFSPLTTWPHKGASLFVQLWEREGGEEWLVEVCTPYYWQTVRVDDLPSLIELLGKVLPLVESGDRLDGANERFDAVEKQRRLNRTSRTPREPASK